MWGPSTYAACAISSQSSLSAAIRRLEDEVGVELLRRSTRRVALTAAGVRLLQDARALLRAVDRFAAPAPRGGALRVGSCPPGRMALLDPIVAEGARAGLTEVVSLREEFSGALLRGLDEDSLDVAIVVGTEASGPGRCVERIATVPLQVALSPSDPRAQREHVRLGELADLTLYVFGDDDAAGWREISVEACRAAGFEPDLFAARYAYSSPELDDAPRFALMPALPWSWASGVALVQIERPAPTISFDLVWRDGAIAAVEAFVSATRRARSRLGWLSRS